PDLLKCIRAPECWISRAKGQTGHPAAGSFWTNVTGMTDARSIGLEAHFTGRLLWDGGGGYEDAREAFNAMVDCRPALIAQCRTREEVIEALAFARSRGLEVAVRGGGHSVAGLGTTEGGLVIDLRRMKSVSVNPTARTARVAGGATW